MIEFIFKSSICLGVLSLCGYYLIRNSTKHKINRFILLAFITFSLVVPLLNISITNTQSQAFNLTQTIGENLADGSMLNSPMTTTSEILSKNSLFTTIAISVYVLVSGILLSKFLFNLFKLVSKSIKSKTAIYNGIPLKLTEDNTSPHSFFKSIFINKNNYKNREISMSLLLHELGHGYQFHSIDIICIELIKVFYWFNPFIYLFKRLIKNNHEFLADDYVINAGINKVEYSNTLIDYTFHHKMTNLASGFDFSLIKNRILMLSKNNQKKRFTFSYASVIAVLSVLFVLVAFRNSNEIFRRNPTDKCDIDLFRTENRAGFIINGDTSELFVKSQERGFIYLISKKGSGRMFSSNTRDTAIHRLDTYELKEYQGLIFVDDNYVGSVNKDDFIIIYHEEKVDVYDNERVDIEQIKLEDLQLRIRKQ